MSAGRRVQLPSDCRHRRYLGRRNSPDARSRTRHAPPSRSWLFPARRPGVFDLLRHAVLQHRLFTADLLQRQLAAVVVEFLEPVKAVAAVADDLAGLADVAELLGKFKQPNLR